MLQEMDEEFGVGDLVEHEFEKEKEKVSNCVFAELR